jgi:hypothetical protein
MVSSQAVAASQPDFGLQLSPGDGLAAAHFRRAALRAAAAHQLRSAVSAPEVGEVVTVNAGATEEGGASGAAAHTEGVSGGVGLATWAAMAVHLMPQPPSSTRCAMAPRRRYAITLTLGMMKLTLVRVMSSAR